MAKSNNFETNAKNHPSGNRPEFAHDLSNKQAIQSARNSSFCHLGSILITNFFLQIELNLFT